MSLFDVHAHLTSEKFSQDVGEVIARAGAAGVSTIVSNGLNITDNEKVLALARAHPSVRPALGYYPVDVVLGGMIAAGIEYPRDPGPIYGADETLSWLQNHADDAVAIGEIGLDRYWVPEQFWAEQEQVFRRLVRLAMEANKPIIIHTRKAEQATLEILEELGAPRVIWHCFSSRVKLAQRIAARGHFLSVPANARRSETFTALLRDLPRGQLLLETDCPYLGPESGVRNEPANVRGTAEYAAELWKTDLVQAEGQFTSNFEAIFGFSP